MSTIEPPPPDDASARHQPATPSGMPRYPQAPPPPNAPLAAPASPPRSIHTAVQLMWVGAVISLLALVATMTTLGPLKSQLRDQLEKNGQQVSESVLDAGYKFAIIFAVVSGLIAIGLWVWMARKNGQGRPWARIVATVLGAINVIATIFGVASGNSTTIASIVSVVNLVIAIVILVLLWRRESSDFYNAHSHPGQLN